MSNTFDILALIEGISYPTEDVVVYLDVAALTKNQLLDEQLNAVTDSGEARRIEAEIAENRKVIEASGLTFTMRGRAFEEAKEVANIFSDEGATEEEILELMHQSIVTVTDANGAVASVPTVDGLRKIHAKVSPAEFSKLVNMTIQVNFSAATYDAEIDAGFPGGSADVA